MSPLQGGYRWPLWLWEIQQSPPGPPFPWEHHAGPTSLRESLGVVLFRAVQVKEVFKLLPVLILPVSHLPSFDLREVQVFQLEGQRTRGSGERGQGLAATAGPGIARPTTRAPCGQFLVPSLFPNHKAILQVVHPMSKVKGRALPASPHGPLVPTYWPG